MHLTLIRKLALVALGLAVMLCSTTASAMFMQSPSVPADRLIKNISAYLEEKPEDPEAHYLLARVHYMVFVDRVDQVRSYEPGSNKKLPQLTDPRQYGKAEGKEVNEQQAIEHAVAAINSFKKAIDLKKDSALYHLGLAGLYEQSAPLAAKIDPNPEPEQGANEEAVSESDRFIREALAENHKAYLLGRDEALKEDSVFLPFYPIAYEAAKAYIKLVTDHNIKYETRLVQQMNADIASIDSKPKAITPIVLRIEGKSPSKLDDLIAPSKAVRFDLDADGTAERRPWVNPDTAILVYDPQNTGKITSGQQLFGNMTFFMLFSDGYRALDSLDDNRDGQLAGEELKGLALWHDRNTNGISDSGEVTPIDQTAIQSLATRQTGKYGIHPMNLAGVTLKDGSTRPTWDWVIPAKTER